MPEIIQQAFTVEDIDRGIEAYVDLYGVGPWFVRGPFVPRSALYRGEPTTPQLTLARAFAGDLMLELIQQHDDTPSVYMEQIDQQGYGFHHWGMLSLDFDADVEHFARRGMSVAFSDVSSTGARIAYIDTASHLPGMTELIEYTDVQRRFYAAIKATSVDWDGRHPSRSDESLAGR